MERTLKRDGGRRRYLADAHVSRSSPRGIWGWSSKVLFVDGDEAEYLALWLISDECFEIGSGFVRKDFQSRGLGSMLYQKIWTLPAVDGKIVLAITQNPVALKAELKTGLMPHLDWDHPIPFRLTCG